MSERVAPGRPADAVRRSPFGTNPQLGARGQRTRQRVLDAALRVFRDVGVQRGSIDRIAREAGCSRAAFYQYFADKDEVLRHLAAQLTLHLDAAVAWLEPVTEGADGWRSLRDLLERWAEVHDRHRPVLAASPQLFEADPVFASGATQARERFVAAIAARVQGSDLAPAAVAAAIDVFLMTSHRALEDLDTLRQAAPGSFPLPATLDALADVLHRALFGLDPAVNVHVHDLPDPPRLPFGPLVSSGLAPAPATGGDAATRAALLDAARRSFLALGYHGTRIDTIAEEAGVSHGTLYTYFDSKGHVAQVLAVEAMRGSSDALQRMPEVSGSASGRAELRRWLGEYNRAQAGEAAMIRVWADALRDSGDPVAETAPTLDWGRRRLAERLAGRGFGDADRDAALLLSLLAVLGSRERSAATLDATALVIDRGFLGRPTAD
jgi:AcrR family transcriptional regulator